MKLLPKSPQKVLEQKAFLRQFSWKDERNKFKANLIALLNKISVIENQPNDESEEHLKNNLRDFLRDTYYKDKNAINTKDKKDLVIHIGNTTNTDVAIIIEAKRPSKTNEMILADDINKKALHQLIFYYLTERKEKENIQIKHLIITDVNNWFIFDANDFDKYIYRNIKIKNIFKAKFSDRKDVRWFYEEISKIIPKIEAEIPCIYFNIREYEEILINNNNKKDDDKKLEALYKILSPNHLLKLPFANDSNSLNKNFYHELLHIIGLTETNKGNKKLIERNNPDERHSGTILENAIIQLDSLDKLSRLERPSQFGSTRDEKLFNVALELSITWINRILFLKLLEAQLVNYHKGDTSYSFLHLDKVKNYDDLNSLFFQVLARKHEDRNEDVKKKFDKVPYLNSSLFEPADLEHDTLFISNLRNDKTIPIHAKTVLKDQHGKKRTGKLNTLEYLFEFLNAYDFGSEGSEDIQEENKTLINASVLGLIFEKINGYKDGSYFTPGFITMYMCRDTIRQAVLQKFNEVKSWNCSTLEELEDKIKDRKEANEIVNSIKICDPAVGSGHFLVSALNEMIAVKHDLKILQDRDGKRLKAYEVKVENDELVVKDEEDDESFTYNPKSKESQRIQETLFHEKQTIIENCLFGVDINANSVKICRLRLWIELLKNAYYKSPTELETLPNIDINIKCGNSLVSRFALDADMKQALKKSKWTIDSYRLAVHTYRNAENKEQKREMERLIAAIKSDFRSEISSKDPKVQKLQKLEYEYGLLVAPNIFKEDSSLYGDKDTQKKAKERQASMLAEIEKLRSDIEAIKANKIFENAFEWRFEFPEVLNNEGDFVGFDVVIGNPPYVQLQSITEVSQQLQRFEFKTFSSMGDLYALFYERGNQILQQRGILTYITGSAWLRTNYGQSLRTYFNQETQLLKVIDLSDCEVFESATVLTSIVSFTKKQDKPLPVKAIRFTKKDQDKLVNLAEAFNQNHTVIDAFPESSWVILDSKGNSIKEKVTAQGTPLIEWDIKINRGILTGFNAAFVIDTATRDQIISEDPNSAELIKPLLRGRDVHRYYYDDSKFFLIGTFPTLNLNIHEYPAIKKHLEKYLPKLNQTGETFLDEKGGKQKTRKKTSGKWFETQDSIAYWEDFYKPKIIYPNMTKFLPFTLDVDGYYTNQKCFILTGPKIYFLTAFLNSKLFRFCFEESFPELQGNTRELNKVIFETIPVKKVADETPFIELVTTILSAKKQEPSTDTSELETQIDQLVYQLYNLTAEEIEIIETSIR